MRLIRKRRNGFALLLTVNICLAVCLGVMCILEAALVFCVVSAISLLLLARQIRRLYDATLIRDNRILQVPSALRSISARQIKKDTEETMVSTFGILIGSEIYRWGLHGVHGVRLNAAQIDKERMYLSFGDEAQTMRVELLHGMTDAQSVTEITQKLWYETGIQAEINDW